ncbi:MAG: hypothetical protein A3I11_09035 [Elusimicrobia bacterium RIFCSPLOWO2_02_FULL_39_32]|nr:MAG: hypothetical protein A3B80_04570 [Elusimicrobia bacterium RIFCSPHIGHO2_02_FULL_39_36]OGR93402.1 MAG: hypothetical protein A3I11_09035 [Elusimicrobia bacterium RIFCSPLOWO2_02_FULL_39_32]OGS00596.1 MAG: hypothetical protein A3G85_00120 [Elusimicrobia bacterium RIFCSPLOWO2_12_FULL_39_28]
MNKKLKSPVKFKDEAEEFKFWSKTNSLDYIDKSTVARGKFPNLKLTSRAIPLRLPVSLIDRLKILAHKKDISYQSLIKIFINREIKKEFSHRHAASFH